MLTVKSIEEIYKIIKSEDGSVAARSAIESIVGNIISECQAVECESIGRVLEVRIPELLKSFKENSPVIQARRNMVNLLKDIGDGDANVGMIIDDLLERIDRLSDEGNEKAKTFLGNYWAAFETTSPSQKSHEK